MRLFVEKVFEGFVSGTNDVHTDAMWNDVLGAADQIQVAATADNVGGGTSAAWTIRSEHSNDGFNWQATGFLPEISGLPAFAMGSTDHSNTLAAYVRYKITLGAGTSANIRLIACGRGDQPVDIHLPQKARP